MSVSEPPMLQKIATRSGLVFDAWVAGPAEGDLVVLLHGYPQSRHAWRDQIPALAGAGYRVVAPDQRGYSPGARPDPADLSNYHYDRLVSDVLDLAAACGHEAGRFHLAGHDWGGQVSWGVADRHPDRLASLTILSRPHPSAFAIALQAPDGDQKYRSRHHRAFLDPATTAPFSIPPPRGCCWRTARDGFASGWPKRVCRRQLSTCISRCLARQLRLRLRSPGIARSTIYG